MLLTHCACFCHDVAGRLIEDAALLIEGESVRAIGERADLEARYPNEERVDLEGRLVLPGLMNAHTHIYSAYARGASFPGPLRHFVEILERQWWRLDKLLTLEDTRLSAYQTMAESIQNGVTCLIDHHASPYHVEGSLAALAEVASTIGMRADLCYELSDRDGRASFQSGLEETEALARSIAAADSSLVRAHVGMHASFTLSDESLEAIRLLKEKTGLGIHCHVSEGIADAMDAQRKHGMTVVERLDRFQLLDEKALLIHLCHICPREMDIMAERQVMAVHNPQSNMGNAVGRTPVMQLLQRGVLLGLGTDAYTNDLFVSAQAAKCLLSHSLADPERGFGEALTLLLDHNPKIAERCFGLSIGRLTEGGPADLAVYDYRPFTPLTADNIGGHLLFGFTGRICTDTMIAGRFVYRNRTFQTFDADWMAERSRERAQVIWSHLKG